jgi:hypothetical protein
MSCDRVWGRSRRHDGGRAHGAQERSRHRQHRISRGVERVGARGSRALIPRLRDPGHEGRRPRAPRRPTGACGRLAQRRTGSAAARGAQDRHMFHVKHRPCAGPPRVYGRARPEGRAWADSADRRAEDPRHLGHDALAEHEHLDVVHVVLADDLLCGIELAVDAGALHQHQLATGPE